VVQDTGLVRADGDSGYETLATVELAYDPPDSSAVEKGTCAGLMPGFEVITPVS
jgi:hypothetical protein